MTIPGIGPVVATALAASVGDAKTFKNGREMAAWLGLVPRQHSTGGKPKLLGISKRGDAYLRKLLIQGTQLVLRFAGNKQDRRSRWVCELATRRGRESDEAGDARISIGARGKCLTQRPDICMELPFQPVPNSTLQCGTDHI
ncbi:MAG: hypothetical protein AUJ56_03990 [Zetaproteobacteria bacterium CG1_02_49_23]|nr:MAG: hypothetical protein AUJ56_03990 [Zetaproteobacteria bacterium CG1_02_49_23]